MPCLPGLPIPIPTLPNGITIGTPQPPPLPKIPALCCKLPIPPLPAVPTLSISLGVAELNAAKAYIKQIVSYVNSLPLNCPKE